MLLAMLASQGVGFIVTILILVASAEPLPGFDALVWAALAGISGVTGLAFFYLALSRGTMGLVAPLAALIGAGVPVMVAVIDGESPDATRWAGIATALLAVVLISLPPLNSGPTQRHVVRLNVAELPIVLLAGLGFAGFFIGIDKASSTGATWWPLAVVRIFGLILVLLGIGFISWRRYAGAWRDRTIGALGIDRFRRTGHTFIGTLPLFIVAGAGDMGGNFFFVLANNSDALSVAVVLASLYPIVTTVLAAVVLRERLRPVQILGVVLATLSVLLLR